MKKAPINKAFNWNGRDCVVVQEYETTYLCRESHRSDGFFGVLKTEVDGPEMVEEDGPVRVDLFVKRMNAPQ